MVLISGVDEVGRGSGAAEIYACACILNQQRPIEGLKDSKKLSRNRREILAEEIKKYAVCWSIAQASLEEIEQLNVHYATLLAMKRAVEGLKTKPNKVFIDGLYVPEIKIPAKAIVKGDDKIQAISAASILAKVARDNMMLEYHQLYPQYGFDQNMGYLTKQHLEALHKYGPCPIHRKTYGPIRELLEIENYKQLKIFG
ncbi:ribonuclease HII [Bacillota bacterium LX-D]|nr:ribonuclease HII [Bacillota bacterium LX-D]